MSTLTLVRHGQAHPFQGRDSTLTAIGQAQAGKLAQFWLARRVQFDEVYTGALPRQAQTAEMVGECYRTAGETWPAGICDPAWNEYDATGALQHFVPANPRLAPLAEAFEQARGTPDENRMFQRLFEKTMTCWLESPVDTAAWESWKVFQRRVTGAIQRLMAGPPGRRIAVFTSGGPIGLTVRTALDAPARAFLDLHWRIRNTSLTQFLFDRDRLTLDSFNSLPHLDETSLWTYR